MIIERKWAMPNRETFKIKPINDIIYDYMNNTVILSEADDYKYKWVDPFVRNSVFKGGCFLTNDLNPEIKADYNLEATEFLQRIESVSVDGVLFDPPYSPRQIKECYNGLGLDVHKIDTQSSFYSVKKDEIKRILKKDGICISFGWNSNGIGKTRGFEIIDILIVAHGGNIHDTICTVERKL